MFCLRSLIKSIDCQENIKESIVGLWKHYEDQVFLIFHNDNEVSLKIPKNIEVKGKYKYNDDNNIEAVFLWKAFWMNGEEIKIKPQKMMITVNNNKLLLYGVDKDKPEGELFIKVL
jgi:long-subunit fatty acid transport protein